jgi:hypothetical protein
VTVALGGSRHLTEERLVRRLLHCIQERGWSVATGCAPGIDATVRRIAVEMALDLTIYAVGSWDGKGWGGKFGTHMEIRGLGATGLVQVRWAAGGYEGSMGERLTRRTDAMVDASDRVIMVTAPDSRGSVRALKRAQMQGKWWKEYRRGAVTTAGTAR